MPKNLQTTGSAADGNFTDDYYREESKKAINQAVEHAVAAGKEAEELRFLLRRAYPFSKPRRSRPYKIWRKVMLAKEAELGFEPKRHKGKEAPSPKSKKSEVQFSSLELLLGVT